MSKLLIILTLCLQPFFAWAQTDTTTLPELISTDWYISISYGNGSSSINHAQESSALTGFSSLGDKSSLSNTSIKISGAHELFVQREYSVTLFADIDFLFGSGDENISGTAVENKLSGNRFGLGSSLNINYEAYDMRIQPYLGLAIGMESDKNTTKYGSISNTYKYDGTLADLSLGVRFFDPVVNLMSFFSITYSSPLSETLSATSEIGASSAPISQSDFIATQLWLRVGFGFMF